MILIFDLFETIVDNDTIDFNRGLKPLWEKHYSDKCTFEEIKAYGEELFEHLLKLHEEGREFPFVKEELPLYAERFGGEVLTMSTEEEADFLMLCNDMEPAEGVPEMLEDFTLKSIPMYVLSNSGFTAAALWEALNRMGIGKYFKNVWSSADHGCIKPDKGLFEQAVEIALKDNPAEGKEDILFIGDTYKTDIAGAHNAGIRSVWINRKSEPDEIGYAAYTISQTADLRKIVSYG